MDCLRKAIKEKVPCLQAEDRGDIWQRAMPYQMHTVNIVREGEGRLMDRDREDKATQMREFCQSAGPRDFQKFEDTQKFGEDRKF